MPGPQTGPQIHVKYCPNCRGDLRPVASANHPPESSHRYVCQVCDRTFEINEMDRQR